MAETDFFLSKDEIARVWKLIERDGEEPTRKRMQLSGETFARALACLRIQGGSRHSILEALKKELDRIDLKISLNGDNPLIASGPNTYEKLSQGSKVTLWIDADGRTGRTTVERAAVCTALGTTIHTGGAGASDYVLATFQLIQAVGPGDESTEGA